MEIKLNSISYTPTCNTMLGEEHGTSLKRDKNGNWIMTCRDREAHGKPMTVAVYSVSDESVEQLERFIKDNEIITLEYRPEFNIFATDQRPWRWSIDYDITSSGETDHGYCILEEYRKYLENDYALLKELKKRFTEMRGEKISEASES